RCVVVLERLDHHDPRRLDGGTPPPRRPLRRGHVLLFVLPVVVVSLVILINRAQAQVTRNLTHCPHRLVLSSGTHRNRHVPTHWTVTDDSAFAMRHAQHLFHFVRLASWFHPDIRPPIASVHAPVHRRRLHRHSFPGKSRGRVPAGGSGVRCMDAGGRG